MKRKLSIAINWASACGGCDVSILDLKEHFLALAAAADVVYWPVAMDFKRSDLIKLEEGSVDVGLFNGSVRTSEQAEDARLMRSRCKVLIAYGSCSYTGGIPGLANFANRDEVFKTAYQDTDSTDNPEGIVPLTKSGHLTLPAFFDRVHSLDQVVETDAYLPGCPPAPESILAAVQLILSIAEGGELPPKGAVIAAEKPLCEYCARKDTRTTKRILKIRRPHEGRIDPELCFLEQGMVCMGPVTAGGCGGLCIKANMPCRGCYGKAPGVGDPGAAMASALGAKAGPEHEDDINRGSMRDALLRIPDPSGTFYRFTLPAARIPARVRETTKEK